MTMLAGRPARVLFDGPQTLRKPRQCVIEGLLLNVVDEAGNVCKGWPPEGSAAHVKVSKTAVDTSDGGRSAKVAFKGTQFAILDGRAELPRIVVDAAVPGTYRLDAQVRGDSCGACSPSASSR